MDRQDAGLERQDGRVYCWKCRKHHPAGTRICVTCGVDLDTGALVPTDQDPEPIDETWSDRLLAWRITPGRIVSLVIYLLYATILVIVPFAAGNGDPRAIVALAFLLFPMMLIWFPDALAGMTVVRAGGVMRFGDRPGIIAFCGWALLVGPPVIYVITQLVA